MKIYRSFLLAIFFSLGTLYADARSSDGKPTGGSTNTITGSEINSRGEILEERLNEIKDLDFSTMKKSEKRALKEEIKEIKREMALDGRITISIGAAILIVLLLILLT